MLSLAPMHSLLFEPSSFESPFEYLLAPRALCDHILAPHAFRSPAPSAGRTNLEKTREGTVLTMEMPGFSAEEISVTVDGANTLTIEAQKKGAYIRRLVGRDGAAVRLEHLNWSACPYGGRAGRQEVL